VTTCPYSVDAIGDMLRARISDLIVAWGLHGRIERHDFVCLNPLRADHNAGSFRIVINGQLQGLVTDFASNEKWSPLSFTAELWFGGNVAQAVRWARAWLGIDGTDPNAVARTDRAVSAAPAPAPDVGAEAETRRNQAFRRYLEGREVLGSPVERYLDGRGISLQSLLRVPRALRFHPDLFHRQSNRYWPAMLAPITSVDGQFLAVHRTWLEIHTNGAVKKAPVDNKKVYGPARGGAIRLWSGTRIDPKTGEVRYGVRLSQAPAGTECDLAEGIEDGLSVVVADQDRRVLVAPNGVSSYASMQLPSCVSTLTYWRQADPPGSAADRAFRAAAAAQRARGLVVREVTMPPGIKDANDWLQSLATQSSEAIV